MDVLDAHPDEVEYYESDAAGLALETPRTPLWKAGGQLRLGELTVDRSHTVRLTSPCVAGDECGPAGVCLAGRCRANLVFTAVARDGDDVVLQWTDQSRSNYLLRQSGAAFDFSGTAESPADQPSHRDVGAA